MKILLSYIHYPVCSGRYARDAFIRLGHDVKTVGWTTNDQIWGMRVDPRYIHQPDGKPDTVFPEWAPDLIIHMDSAFKYHHPHYQSIPHCVWGLDNHVRDYRQDGIAHYFLAHNHTSLTDMDAPDVSWLPCGYDPTVFNLGAGAKRVWDASLIGVLYENRGKLVHEIAHHGRLSVFADTGILFEDCAAIYQESKIALNASAAHDLSQRIFENAACGCVVLTDELPDLKFIKYPAGAIVQYKDLKDAVKQAQAILKDWTVPDTAWLKDHTWDKRGESIIAWYEKTYTTKRGN